MNFKNEKSIKKNWTPSKTGLNPKNSTDPIVL
jgi:hypothetical protein